MSSMTLSDNPVYAFMPVEDPDAGVWQIRIAVDGMEVTIGTSLVVLGSGEAMAVADRLNRALGLDRAAWTALAARCLRTAGAGNDTLH